MEGIFLGCIPELKFADHNFHDLVNFPDFKSQYYMRIMPTKEYKPPKFHFPQWALVLERSRITNLLDIPHFGHGTQITYCIKTLLSCVHAVYLWLDLNISIDVELINRITRFPLEGEYPTLLFTEKHGDRNVATTVMRKYDTTRGARGIMVSHINDQEVKFKTQILESKFLYGNRHN